MNSPIQQAELIRQIEEFSPVITPCEGSIHPWRHYPSIILDGLSRKEGIRCGCGRVFDGEAHRASVRQSHPELWDAFQQFKAHIKELA